MNYCLSDKQLLSVGMSTKLWNVWEGSVRSGKTIASIYRWIQYILTAPAGELIMIGLTTSTLYRNVISPMEDMLGDQMRYLQSSKKIKLWGRTIHCLHAKDASSSGILRGITCAGCLGDEITLWNYELFKMLQSRMSVAGAKVFITTNPDSPYHWFKKDFLDDPNMSQYIERFSFRLTDNQWLMEHNPDYVKQLIASYKEGTLHYKRFIEGLWSLAEGIIYDMFSEEEYCYNDDKEMPDIDRWFVTVDYGTKNPCVFLLIGESSNFLGEKTYYIHKEYWYCGREEIKTKSANAYVKDMFTFLDGIIPEAIYIDPSELAFIVALKDAGLNMARSADNDVSNGIKLYGMMLDKNRVRIHRRCKNTLAEHSLYSWDPKKTDDTPLKDNDHGMDAIRYFFNTRVGYDRIYNIEKIVGAY